MYIVEYTYFTGDNLLHRMLTQLLNVLVDIDECASNPCMNDAACADGVDLFTCTCAAEFTGAICDVGKIIF